MSSLAEGALGGRPIVVVEDHLYHVTEVLSILEEEDPALLAHLTVVCLDRPGPDTQRTVRHWLRRHGELRIAARHDSPPDPELEGRWLPLDDELFDSNHRFATTIARLLRRRGLLLQDIQLSTLRFLPRDRWWESIYLANLVRGMFPEEPPKCRFFSNKRGYEATFGRDLMEAGFDPRDLLHKDDLRRLIRPTLRTYFDRAFPFDVELTQGGGNPPWAAGEEDQRLLERELDLLAWPGAGGALELGGRLVAPRGTDQPSELHRLVLPASSPEIVTWRALLADLLADGEGLPVLAVGTRLAPPGAGRAEITNIAARHAHTLRRRLRDRGALVTADHAYRLRRQLTVGLAQRRP